MGMKELLKKEAVQETKTFSAKLRIDTIEKINEIADNLKIKKADVVDSAVDDAYALYKKVFREERKKQNNNEPLKDKTHDKKFNGE